MRALVTFESVYGNTRAIAEAVGEGLGALHEVKVASHDQLAREDVERADLVVVGAPTHMHALPTSLSRKMAATDRNPALTGSAARGIAKRLRRRGFELAVEPQGFFVDDAEGPLADRELERARACGETVASQITSTPEETAR